MKTSICSVCRDQCHDITKRWDEHMGLVCPECYNVMNGHLGLWAMGLIEGVIAPEPLRETEESQ